MRVLSIFVRELFAVLAVVGFLCVGAQQATAQTSFTYPPFPTSSGTGLQVNSNGSASVSGTKLELTTSGGSEVASAWYTNPSGPGPATLALANGFTSTFTFQLTGQGGISGSNGKPGADGIAFVVQNGSFGGNNSGIFALGPHPGTGGEIGFAGLTNSVAVQFDTWNNSEYGDTPATNDPYSSADQITIESCGAAANTVNHNAGCSFGTVDLSKLSQAIYLADGAKHTATISYSPPTASYTFAPGACPIGSVPFNSATPGCGSLVVLLDGQTVLSVAFNLAYINDYADATDAAYVGFTGATGGSYETQDIWNWGFMANSTTVVAQQLSISNPPALTSNYSGTNGSGPTQQSILDYTQSGGLSPNNGVTNPVLLSTNNALATNIWPQYVVGTPWATSLCTVKAGNGPTGLCSQYINVCYQSGMSPNGATDLNCPSITNLNDPSDFIVLKDVFDWAPGGKIQPAPGTTFSFIDFSPTATDSQWLPTSTQPINPVCLNVSGTAGNIAPTACDVLDKLVEVYGDQTTSRSTSKPKGSTFVTAYNVPMPSTSVIVTNCPSPIVPKSPLNDSVIPTDGGFENPNFAASLWNNGACSLDFVVYPANLEATPGPANGFQAAPPASFFYGNGPAVPVPGTIPTGDHSSTNPDPVFGSCATPSPITGPCAVSSWDTGVNILLSGFGEGQHTIHWSAQDTAGITEKYVQLDSTNGDRCANPETPSSPFSAPCYNTSYFTTQVNVDSFAPVFATSSCASDGNWHKADVTLACQATDATSGIGTASPNPTIPSVPVPGGTVAAFNILTSVPTGTETNNAIAGPENLCDLAMNCTSVSVAGNLIDKKAPTITVTTPTPPPAVPATFQAYASVPSSFACADGGSGVAPLPGGCHATLSNLTVITSGGLLDTKPTQAGLTTKSLTVNSVDNVGNASVPVVIGYNVSCHYASVQLKTPTLTKGFDFAPAATMLTDCLPTTQKVIIELTLTGKFGKSCATGTQNLFIPIPVTIPANTNRSPLNGVFLFVPSNACSGPGFTFSTSTYSNVNGKIGTLLDSVSQTVTVQ
jgi:hypothetical protein